MPDAYNPWGAPVFPTADDNAMQPETFVPQGVQDWTRQAAPKDYNILSQIAGSLGKALMYPGQVAQSQTPISTEDMVGPAFNLAGMLTLGAGAIPAEANSVRTGMSFPLYHGSPQSGLTEIAQSQRGALGPGAYFTPADNVAARYGENVYQLPEKSRDIFNGLGDKYGSYEGWKSDKARLLAAAEPDKQAELQAIMDKMWTGDGYPMHTRIAQMYRDEGKAQDLYRRAGFEGYSGHADGPEVVLFDKQPLTPPAPMGIKAYHGSPHDFDKFDLSKIGTGEGAQAYGHGLYFADSEGVAKSYRDALMPKDNASVLAQKFLDERPPLLPGEPWTSQDQMNLANKRLDRFVEEQQGNPALTHKDGLAKTVEDARKIIQSGSPPGHMYEVNINADPSHFLDWDKPLSQQPQHIQDALQRIYQQNPPDHHILGKLDLSPADEGSFAYSKLQHSFPEMSDTTNALREAGIPGIKYLDQGSRGTGQGSSNYVVFNHDLIDIMRKYAVPGMLGAPILANALSEQKT